MTEIPKSAWVPPGVDPTNQDYPLERPRVSGCLGKIGHWIIYGMALYGFFAMYQQTSGGARAGAPASTPTQAIAIVVGTATPSPTPGTPTPGAPTNTPTPTAIPPGALATYTPGPWMITRFYATYTAKFEVKPRETIDPILTPTAEGPRSLAPTAASTESAP